MILQDIYPIDRIDNLIYIANLPNLMHELQSSYEAEVPLSVLEEYCRRYMHYYHRDVEHQPVRFYGAWGWSEARRREFRKAFDATGLRSVNG